MKITTYEHACFTVEIDGKLLVIDPGNFTKEFEITENIVAVVVTHNHPDHFDPDMLAAIYNKNPKSLLVSLPEIVAMMPDHASAKVHSGDTLSVGPFELAFFGDKHAEIHHSMPLIDNIAVMINDTIYYPGDSFDPPHLPVEVLALPASGPWFKTSDAVDFMLAVQPSKVFPTHDIHNSEAGQALFDRIVGGFAEQAHIHYMRLAVDQSIDV